MSETGEYRTHLPDAGPSVQFITAGETYRDLLLRLLRGAESEILLETYIFSHDDLGREVLTELARACRRGVRVRCIIDGFGSYELIREHLDTLLQSPARFRIYHPLPWPFSRLQQDSFINPRGLVWILMRSNRRDHRKIIVVDRRCAILGSRNISDESLHWQEASLLLRDQALEEIVNSFEMVWARGSSLHKRPYMRERLRRWPFYRSRRILTNLGLRRRKWHRGFIYNSIRRARRRIWITTPYLNPHRSFLRLLKRKAREGLDVRILLPTISDITLAKWLAETIYHDLLQANIQVYEYRGNILHAKALLVDDAAILGSSNFNLRSFRRDLEIDYHATETALVHQIAAWQESAMERAERVHSVEQVNFLLIKRGLRFLLSPLKSSF